MFDLSVNLGNLLSILAMAGVGIGFVLSLKYEGKITRAYLKATTDDVKEVRGDVSRLEDEMKNLVEVLVQQGRHEERMTALDGRMLAQGARLDDLSRQVMRLYEPNNKNI